MKILQVSHGLPPKEHAGVELYTLHLSRALSQLNHQVYIFCREEDPKKEEFFCFDEEVGGLRVTRVVNNLKKINNFRIFYDNTFFDQAFLRILKEEKPDLVHFQHIFVLSGRLVQIAKGEGLPVVFTLHDFFVLCPRIQLLKLDHEVCPGPRYGLNCVSCLGFFPPKIIKARLFLKAKDILPPFFIRWTEPFFIPSQYLEGQGYEIFHRQRYMYNLLKVSDFLLTPSQYVKDFFISLYPFLANKMEALPLGIPFFEQHGLPKKPDHKLRFCYFGSILPHKGVHVLIEAFKILPKGKAILTIIGARTSGNQDYYDSLKAQVSGFEVYFHGPYQRDDLPEILSDQDVMVLPAIWPETFSIVIREANLLGLPVIASRIGAIPAAIEEGINGFLFRTGDSHDLSKYMIRFIENPRLLKEMFSKLPKPKSMAEHAKEVGEVYKKIIAKKK